MKSLYRLALLTAVVMLLPLISQATIHQINMSGFSFSPTGTVVNYGDTVRWRLVGGVHTTTSDVSSPKSWNSGTMSMAGQTFDVVFVLADGAGPFPYHCIFHVGSNMVDTIRVNLPTIGACCLPNGFCIDIDQATCLLAGGTYNGDGSDCVSTQCPEGQLGACCLPGGTCADVFQIDCIELGGTFMGQGTTCPDVQCPSACCTGTTGNVDGDLSDVVDISDLSAVVDYLFFGGSISSCFEENDVDTSASVDISDLQALIDFLFFGASLPSCP